MAASTTSQTSAPIRPRNGVSFTGAMLTPAKNVLSGLDVWRFRGKIPVYFLGRAAVQFRGPFGAFLGYSAHDLGNIVDGVASIARVYSLRAKARWKSLPTRCPSPCKASLLYSSSSIMGSSTPRVVPG